MIAKEAIETLKANYPDACYEQLREAVDAAIEALKAQGVAGDTIYRQTAIDAMYKILHDYFWANDEELDAIIATLNDLPSAQPENQVHLCDSCRYIYPECPSEKGDVIFGNGKGNDNICACNKYEPSAQPEPLKITIDPPTADELERIKQAMRNTPVMLLPSAQPEEDCDTCKHGYFGDDKCNNCRVRYPSHYERRTDESD